MKKWMIKNKRADFAEMMRQCQIDELTARLLCNRGVTEAAEIKRFLQPDIKDMYDPFLLPDMARACVIIRRKIKEGRRLRIIGDYDVDGVVSVYVLLAQLTALGAQCDFRIPDRVRDGYGLNTALIEAAAADGIDTIVTCDNGIAAYDEIALAGRLGMTVIVTDHHETPEQLPPAAAVVDAKRTDNVYPYPLLCGATVAYKLCEALTLVWMAEETALEEAAGEESALEKAAAGTTFERLSLEKAAAEANVEELALVGAAAATTAEETALLAAAQSAARIHTARLYALRERYLPFLAIATICDAVDLTGENRLIAKLGIALLRETENVGLLALLRENELTRESLDTYRIGFVLGPCFNASGRLESADVGVQLLMETDEQRAAQYAAQLKELNATRKQMTTEGLEAAIALVERERYDKDRVIVVYLPECHESLAGIIAGRLRERYGRPAFVLTKGETSVKGSGRSIEAYGMYEALCGCDALLLKYGGHPMAAGLSIAEENISAFRKQLNDACTLTDEELLPKTLIDVVLPFGMLTEERIEQLSMLEPFGKENPKPVFAERQLTVLGARVIGKAGKFLKFRVRNANGRELDALYFGDLAVFEAEARAAYGEAELKRLYRFEPNAFCMSVLYYPSVNTFRDMRTIQITISDWQFEQTLS